MLLLMGGVAAYLRATLDNPASAVERDARDDAMRWAVALGAHWLVSVGSVCLFCSWSRRRGGLPSHSPFGGKPASSVLVHCVHLFFTTWFASWLGTLAFLAHAAKQARSDALPDTANAEQVRPARSARAPIIRRTPPICACACPHARRAKATEGAGCWLLAAGCWRLAAGGWLLAAGGWRLAAGGWRLAAGGWILIPEPSAFRSPCVAMRTPTPPHPLRGCRCAASQLELLREYSRATNNSMALIALVSLSCYMRGFRLSYEQSALVGTLLIAFVAATWLWHPPALGDDERSSPTSWTNLAWVVLASVTEVALVRAGEKVRRRLFHLQKVMESSHNSLLEENQMLLQARRRSRRLPSRELEQVSLSRARERERDSRQPPPPPPPESLQPTAPPNLAPPHLLGLASSASLSERASLWFSAAGLAPERGRAHLRSGVSGAEGDQPAAPDAGRLEPTPRVAGPD